MKLTRILAPAAFAFAAMTATPALAASVVNPDNSVTLQPGSPLSWTFNYNGFNSAAQNALPGLTSEITFNFLNAVGNTFNFSYTLKNTSTAPIDSAQLVAFGFNATPDFQSATTGAGDLFNVIAAGNQPNGLPNLDFCLKDDGQSNNCSGAQGSSGLAKGAQASGTFSLTFASPTNPLTLSDFSVRYQALNSTTLGIQGGSASGQVVAPVPEPGTWALMLVGFGAIGYSMRRRRFGQQGLLQVA